MKKLVLLIIVLVFFFGCNQESSIKSVENSFYDTIKLQRVIITTAKNGTNDNLYFNYYKRYGLVIQNYYRIIDSLGIYIDNDNVIDTLLVISPISLDDPDYYTADNDSAPKRLLIEVLSNKRNNSRLGNKYSNIVSNRAGPLLSYVGLSKTKNGFLIKHEAGGNKASWRYAVEFIFNNQNNLFVKSINKECEYEDKVDSIKYELKMLPVSKLNIDDTLKINCNCDKSWESLMKK